MSSEKSFGPNEWLVDEFYEQYLKDKNSVDPAWWDFFATYQPKSGPTAATNAATAAHTPMFTAQQPGGAATPPPPVRIEAAPLRDMAPAVELVPASQLEPEALKGPAARVVTNMEASLQVPTATSVRAVPAKLLIDNRVVINNHLARGRGGKVSFTHLIAYAIVRALRDMPEMNSTFTTLEGKPAVQRNASINLGIAIDLTKSDGNRQLVVPAIKHAEQMDFAQFWITYEDVVRRARSGKLAVDDFSGVTVSLTNPGGIGTVHSVPRLMQGQAAIIGVGALEYPAEFQGTSEATLVERAIGKVVTLTSTYDHRVIQGAQSGEFLRLVHQYLLGDNDFYADIFTALRIPYAPIKWAADIATVHDSDVNKTARVHELIRAFRDLPGRHVYMSAKLEKSQDEMGRVFYAPSMPGNKTGQQLPYFFDEVLALRVEKDADGNPQLHLFGQLKRIAKQWLETCLVCKGGTDPAQRKYKMLADMA